ncbi:hypothetical protein J437_LFUL017617 [Ladona fulva]|uniref:Reverse transcriptase n=1 Tax=Ladona fulva TaxID=123851 RepID=A0A8K0KGE8_LADFU|nr:hypothetical protein J437_LFUL017617 [Ladona fulva]
MGYRILESEVRQALKEMKRGKAPGVDELPAELMKNINDKGVENVLEDFLKTVMVPILKKKGTTECEEHRTISLISHDAKIMLRILNRRMVSKMEEGIGEEQFGFRKEMGTRDTIGLLNIIGERYLERERGLCLYALWTLKKRLIFVIRGN